jgi:hypothetical protein
VNLLEDLCDARGRSNGELVGIILACCRAFGAAFGAPRRAW